METSLAFRKAFRAFEKEPPIPIRFQASLFREKLANEFAPDVLFQTSNSRMEIEQSSKPLLLDDMVAWFLPICSKPQDQTKTTKVFQAYACFHVLLFPLIFFAH